MRKLPEIGTFNQIGQENYARQRANDYDAVGIPRMVGLKKMIF